MDTIQIKRIYEPAAEADGFRVLVDRLWPRGLRKATAHIDTWDKDVAPSDQLRKWFAHDPAKWQDFKKKYMAELKASDAAGRLAMDLRSHKKVTLLYGAHDEEHNNAVVLQEYLRRVKKL